MSTLPPPVPSAYRRQPKLERLVHVGYNVTLSEEILQLIRDLFPAAVVPDDLRVGPHITAVLHVSQGAKQDEMHAWFKKADKNKEDEARVRSIYHRLDFKVDKKDNVIKSCRGIVALYITVGGNHLYLNIYNNTDTRPFQVKKLVNAGAFTEIKLETPLEVTATAYKHE